MSSGVRSRWRACMSVSIWPGCSELTRTPEAASSLATDLVIPRTAHLPAAYAVRYGVPMRPATEETLMIEPPPRAAIAGATVRMPRNTPTWLTSCTRRKSSSVVFLEPRGEKDAGVVHEHVDAAVGLERPGRDGLPVRLACDVVGVRAGTASDVGRQLSCTRLVGVSEEQVRALLGEAAGDRRADPASGAGHEHNLSVQAPAALTAAAPGRLEEPGAALGRDVTGVDLPPQLRHARYGSAISPQSLWRSAIGALRGRRGGRRPSA